MIRKSIFTLIGEICDYFPTIILVLFLIVLVLVYVLRAHERNRK